MEASENSVKLYYNTEVEKLAMPEYGRLVLKMVEQLKDIPERGRLSVPQGLAQFLHHLRRDLFDPRYR